MEGDKIMWEYIIITCMVTHFGGEPINKCFSSVSEKKYPDVQICKAAAKAAAAKSGRKVKAKAKK